MKNLNKKYLIKLVLVFIITFSVFYLFLKTTNAANGYFYETQKSNTAEKYEFGFDTKEKCEASLKNVGPGWQKSESCYVGKEAVVTKISPTEGEINGGVVITGSDFKMVSDVSFYNGIKSNFTVFSPTEIRIGAIPSGATTGPITIKTTYRGTVKTPVFKINATTDLYWWYTNLDKRVVGVAGLYKVYKGVGFEEKTSCDTARNNYVKNITSSGITSSNIAECFQKTVTEVDKLNQDDLNNSSNFDSDNGFINVDPKINIPEYKSVYRMLAPIGGITCMDSSGKDTNCISNDIGKYLNVIFKLAIGICAALAVIMLIINGVKYMGDESVFGKTEAKKQMFGAIVGLLIALGAWALLNTINPALTGQGGLNISSANIEIEEPPMVAESTGLPALGIPLGTQGTPNYCPDGRDGVVVGNKTIMNTCKTISSKVAKLISDALAQNINLSGSSFRSYSDQKQARITNKCPDALTSPPESCKPPTAKPGTSMHEGGLAIDFKCDGQIIRTTDNKCFIWLTKNAQSAGLKNYAKEPWHWSTNGR